MKSEFKRDVAPAVARYAESFVCPACGERGAQVWGGGNLDCLNPRCQTTSTLSNDDWTSILQEVSRDRA